jgi:hypothetical protein
LPLAVLDEPAVTKDFLDWRDSMRSGPRQADYAWTVLMLLMSCRALGALPLTDRQGKLNGSIMVTGLRRFGRSTISKPSCRSLRRRSSGRSCSRPSGQRQGDLLLVR